ncbi:MAG: DUF2249 domain-containing protein [Halodesulfurarchaeum sp.]
MNSERDVSTLPPGEARDEIVEFVTAGTPGDELLVVSTLHPQSWMPQAQIEHDAHLKQEEATRDGETWRVELQVADEHSDDPVEFDVRELPPDSRHEVLTGTFDRLSPGGEFILINDHDPKPLYYELRSMHGDRVQWEYRTRDAGSWEVKIGKEEATESEETDVTASFDVREIPKQERHPTIHHRFEGLAEGDVLEVIAPHEPRGLKREFNQQYAGGFDWTVTDENANRCIVRITKEMPPSPDDSSSPTDESSPAGLTVTGELDVRELPPAKRHEQIFESYRTLSDGEGFVLINDHDPKPLYHQFEAETGDAFHWEYQQTQPGEFRVLLGKEADGSGDSTDADPEAPF